MSKTEPIRNKQDLQNFKDYYLHISPQPRNYMLIILGLNTALRIGDILELKWNDVYDFSRCRFRSHLRLAEHKTGKITSIVLNDALLKALSLYRGTYPAADAESYLFPGQRSNTPLSRCQAYRIIRTAARSTNLEGHISCHSLRKTFGYHAWKLGIEPVLLMDIYNHSSYQITKRYLCIGQDERDSVFMHNIL